MLDSSIARVLKRHGRDVTLGSVSEGSKDSYGDPSLSYSDSTVTAMVTSAVSKSTVENLFGAVDEIDAVLYTQDSDIKDGDRVDENGDGTYDWEITEVSEHEFQGSSVVKAAAVREVK